MAIEFEDLDEKAGIDDIILDYTQPEDIEKSEVPEEDPEIMYQKMFSDPRISEAINTSITETSSDGSERVFLSSMSEEGAVIANKPFKGSPTGIKVHLPSAGEEEFTHPAGQGMSLEQNATPYFMFHTHPGNGETDLSPLDLYELFNLARQNFILQDGEAGHWINPLSAVATESREVGVYQISGDIIAKMQSEEAFLDLVGDCVIKLGKKLRIPEADEATDLYAFSGEMFMYYENGEIVYGVPKWIGGHITEAYEMAGIKSTKFNFDPNLPLSAQMPKMPVMEKYKERD